MKQAIGISFVLLWIAITESNAALVKRDRGDNLLHTISANTMGKGNAWVEASGLAFIWDNDGKLRLFPRLEVRWGILEFLQFKIYSRLLSYSFQPGFAATELKLTLPTNRGIRFWGTGLAIQYEKGLLKEFKSSIGGYRDSATGFSPEGFLFGDGTLSFLLANEIDLIALSSFLPFTFYLNLGYALANNRKYAKYDQFLLRAGLDFKGVAVDFFLEYALDAFKNFSEPLLGDDMPAGKRYHVWFRENEMYVTPGARIRYGGGLTLTGAVSILASSNKYAPLGALADADKVEEEIRDNITDGFSPFYADWIIRGFISYPIRYRQPAAEIYRGFLLKKNVKRKKVIDIDEKLKAEKEEEQQEVDEQRRRLEQIQERKKKVMDEVKLD